MRNDAPGRWLIHHFFARSVVVHDHGYLVMNCRCDRGRNVVLSKRLHHAPAKLLEAIQHLVIRQEQTLEVIAVERCRELAENGAIVHHCAVQSIGDGFFQRTDETERTGGKHRVLRSDPRAKRAAEIFAIE